MNRTLSQRRAEPLTLRWGPLTLYAALLTLSFGLCGGAYAIFPELRPLLVLEDGLIENMTIAFYLLGVGSLVGLAGPYRLEGWTGLAALCVLGVLEEISYGQRLFPSLTFPTLPSGMTFDALHDLARVAVKQFERLDIPWYGGFLLSALVVMSVAFWLLRHHLRATLRAVSTPRSAWLYVALAAGLAVVALLVDSKGHVSQKMGACRRTFRDERCAVARFRRRYRGLLCSAQGAG